MPAAFEGVEMAMLVEISLREKAGLISLLILDVALHAKCKNIKAEGKALTVVSSSEKLNKPNLSMINKNKCKP